MKKLAIGIFVLIELSSCHGSKTSAINPGLFHHLLFDHKIIELSSDGIVAQGSTAYCKYVVAIYQKNKTYSSENCYADAAVWKEIETRVNGGKNEFEDYFFNQNNIVNVFHGAKWLDTLVLSEFEISDIQFTRLLLSSTEKQTILIFMSLPQKYVYEVIQEAPEYFNKRGSQWTLSGIGQLGEKIRQGKTESKILEAWYADTAKLIEGLEIR